MRQDYIFGGRGQNDIEDAIIVEDNISQYDNLSNDIANVVPIIDDEPTSCLLNKVVGKRVEVIELDGDVNDIYSYINSNCNYCFKPFFADIASHYKKGGKIYVLQQVTEHEGLLCRWGIAKPENRQFVKVKVTFDPSSNRTTYNDGICFEHWSKSKIYFAYYTKIAAENMKTLVENSMSNNTHGEVTMKKVC